VASVRGRGGSLRKRDVNFNSKEGEKNPFPSKNANETVPYMGRSGSSCNLYQVYFMHGRKRIGVPYNSESHRCKRSFKGVGLGGKFTPAQRAEGLFRCRNKSSKTLLLCVQVEGGSSKKVAFLHFSKNRATIGLTKGGGYPLQEGR